MLDQMRRYERLATKVSLCTQMCTSMWYDKVRRGFFGSSLLCKNVYLALFQCTSWATVQQMFSPSQQTPEACQAKATLLNSKDRAWVLRAGRALLHDQKWRLRGDASDAVRWRWQILRSVSHSFEARRRWRDTMPLDNKKWDIVGLKVISCMWSTLD